MSQDFPNVLVATYIIPANSQFDIPFVGNTIRAIESTGAFRVSFNGLTSGIELQQGLSYTTPDEVEFEKVTLKNETGSAITTKIFIGKGRIDDNRLTVTSGGVITVQNTSSTPIFSANMSPINLIMVPDVAVNATSAAQIISGNTLTKEVLISNPVGNNTPIRVGGASVGAANGVEVPIGGGLSLTTASQVWVYNPKAAAITIPALVTRG